MAYVIAEIGFNHGGDIGLAIKMVEAAAMSGADAVKFQSFHASDIYAPDHELFTLIEDGELSIEDHRRLKKAADENKIDFLSTPFSPYWVDVLESLNPAGYKIASMDVNNPVLLKAVAKTGRRVYLSTGASDMEEIGWAVDTLKSHGAGEIYVLHCVSNYPTKPEDAHLGLIRKIRKELGTRTGFSDHTLGVFVPLAAIALGAEVIEKHFTIDKSIPGGDNAISATPDELREIVTGATQVEAAVRALESATDRPDKDKKSGMRRGIYAAKNISEGEVVTMESLTFRRPEITPMQALEKLLDKPAKKTYKQGDPL